MSFWRTFGFQTVSAIETILEGQDFTLEQLLDEDEILQETKAQNKKLIDFIVEHASLKKLLDYITKEPAEDADSTKKFKYPFLCCEILAAEVWAVCDGLCQHQDLMDELFGFLERDLPLNPLLTSYTCRVIAVLLQKKSTETISFMKEKNGIISNFIKHLGNASVMDLLLKIIANDENIGGQGTLEWLCKTDLIPSLVSKFDPKLPEDVHENASQALCDIITVSSNNLTSPIIAQLESEEIIRPLFISVLAEGSDSPLVHGLAVVIQLLRRHSQPTYDRITTIDQLPPFLKAVTSSLDLLHRVIGPGSKSKDRSQLTLTFGTIEPLGLPRLRTVEFFAALFRTNYGCIEESLMKLNVLNSCLDLFFAHQWNNFLHQVVEQMIQGILEGENEDLKISLLRDCKLPERICEANKLNEEDLGKPKGMRRGYMGYITIIATNLNNMALSLPTADKILAENPGWQDYVRGPLASIQDKETQPMTSASEPAPGFDEQDDLEEDFETGRLVFETNADFSTKESTLTMEDDSDEDDEQLFERRIEDETTQEVWIEKEIREETPETPETQETQETQKDEETKQNDFTIELNHVSEQVKEVTV